MRTGAAWGGGLYLAVLFCLLGASGHVTPAAAEEAPARISEKEHKRRHSKLRTMAGRWITQRKAFPSRCPMCQGRGKRMGSKNGRPTWVACKQCATRGAWVSKKHYQAVYYDMRTPAFRALPGIQDQLGRQYTAARSGRPWPSLIKRYRLRDREMVDDTHGVVWFLFNASKTPTATYWIWSAKAGGTSGTWCLYDARSDGPWPEGDEDEAPVASGSERSTPVWETLEPEEASGLRQAITQARLTFRAYEFVKRGSLLLIRLKPWSDTKGRKPADRVGPDAVRLMRAIFTVASGWDRVESEWRAQWRDAYGRIDLKPTWIAGMTRSQHDAVLWNTKTLEEQIQLIDWKDVPHDGWESVQGTRPTPAPVKPLEPTPDEPTPTEPGPDEPTPEEPAPDRPAPTPQPTPPVQPPPTAPESFELPKLTAKAQREANKGLARMKALFDLAKEAHNEGVVAHGSGSHDFWQEKLSEARTHLEEIEEAWLEDVVAHMPGADEGTKDAVANENFGDIWDDIYKLKAMVRKMSALR